MNDDEFDLEESYVIEGVHPSDFFHQYKDDLIGKTVTFSYARKNRNAGDGYIYGHAEFCEPFDTGEVIFDHTTFYGIKVSKWTQI